MTVISLGSVRGAPGVTTTALLLAGGMDGAVLAEADLAGGVLAIRYGLGREPGLTTFAAARSGDPGEWQSHAQSAGGVPVLVGPDAPYSSETLWRGAGARLESAFQQVDAPAVVADLGRLGPDSPLLSASDVVIVLVRPVAEHLVTLSHFMPFLTRTVGSARLTIVLVGDGPYRAGEVGPSLDVEVIGDLPDDPRAASMLVEGGRSRASFARTRLARAAAGLSADVHRMIGDATALAGVAR